MTNKPANFEIPPLRINLKKAVFLQIVNDEVKKIKADEAISNYLRAARN